MNTGGDAAEQLVRMSLNGVEVAVRLAGTGAKNLAILIYTILSSQEQTAGKARLATMLKSGKELTVFSVKNEDLKLFTQEAKQYGVLYCALKDPNGSPDGMTDIMVRSEDAAKINRIVERFQFAAVDTAKIKADIQQERAGQDTETQQDTQLIDDLLGQLQTQGVQDKAAPVDLVPYAPPIAQEVGPENPTPAGRPDANLSGDSSQKSDYSKMDDPLPPRSVLEELKDIRTEQQATAPGQAKSRWNGQQTMGISKSKGKRVRQKGKGR